MFLLLRSLESQQRLLVLLVCQVAIFVQAQLKGHFGGFLQFIVLLDRTQIFKKSFIVISFILIICVGFIVIHLLDIKSVYVSHKLNSYLE